jgi:uncharacterized membrane protein YdbT with pleckstrin-like domain
MAITLHSGEQVRIEARIHWSSYVRPAMTALVVCTLVVLGMMAYMMNNRDSRPEKVVLFLPFAVLGFWPLVSRWLQNRSKTFIVTSHRIYVEEGLIGRFSTELPLNKVNDVTMRQSLLQRVLGAGDITVLTGNDLTTSFQNIADPLAIREAISQGR